METAIKLAIGGGYDEELTRFSIVPNDQKDNSVAMMLEEISRAEWLWPRIWSDPAFWIALSKSMGWKEKWYKCGMNCNNNVRGSGWVYQMHRFVDWIAEGKSIDTFFEELLSKS